MDFLEGARAEELILREAGLRSIDELFRDVPAGVRRGLAIPQGLSEAEVRRRVEAMLARNHGFGRTPHFLGAGFYQHWVPSEVRHLASRSEFLTAYTPYQSEASQGFLQAMFEYQTAVCALMEMDVANASLYDGATALAEGALMAARVTGRREVLVPRALLADRRETLRAYAEGPGLKVLEYAYDPATGQASLEDIAAKATERTAAVVLENPNFFGMFEARAQEVADLAHGKGALLVVGVNPVSLGLVRGPGAYGADIAYGEGQPLGQPPTFGGPALGLFACRRQHLRMLPGRVVGQTVDQEGRRAFCLTLQTREQHIRRENATSNICTNEGLNALMALLYLAILGGRGLERLARLNASRARALAQRIAGLRGYALPFQGHFFNEFVVQAPVPVRVLARRLREHGVVGGLSLEERFPELGHATLLCVTEAHPPEAVEALVAGLEAAAA